MFLSLHRGFQFVSRVVNTSISRTIAVEKCVNPVDATVINVFISRGIIREQYSVYVGEKYPTICSNIVALGV